MGKESMAQWVKELTIKPEGGSELSSILRAHVVEGEDVL